MKQLLVFLSIIYSSFAFSQTYYGQIINKENDTLSVQILIKGNAFMNNKILSIQEKITVLNNGISKDYYPKDLKSFLIRMEDKKSKIYDNINDSIFAERLYSNKAKLYYKLVRVETKRSPYFSIYRVFLVKNPNQEKMIELIPNGFSRLITRNEMLNKFTDCKIIYDKITNDEIKIKNEDALVEFIATYEKNCLND